MSFYATVSPQQINKDDYFTYRIVIENTDDISQVIPPAFSNFIVLNGPSQERGVSSANGHTTQYTALVYTLKPKQAGRRVINAAMAVIAGKKYKSNDVALTVINGKSSASSAQSPFAVLDPFLQEPQKQEFTDYIFRKGDNIADKVKKNMELRVEVDKTSCYVGEPVVAVYKLYTRLKSESKATKNPTFSGFSVVDMQPSDISNYSTGKLNGREYNIYILRKAQLYALQPGVIGIESAEIENNLQFIKEEYAQKSADAGNLFSDFSGSLFPPEALINQKVVLKSTPVDITVKPLPEENKPAAFTGAVGNFTIEATLQKPLFSTDESGKLSVTVSGSGNIQLLTSPEISWPKGIESFEPRLTDNLVKTTVPVSGTKRFEYSFSANDSGHYVIPAIKLSFFDPVSATYKTAASEPVFFQVTKGSGHPKSLTAAFTNEEPSFFNSFFFHRWWIVIFIALILLIVLAIFIVKDRKPARANIQTRESVDTASTDQPEKTGISSFKSPLAETESCMVQSDCAGFYKLLNKDLLAFIAGRFSADSNAINSTNILSLMEAHNVSIEIAARLQRLMQQIEWQLYTPFEKNETMTGMYDEAMAIIQGLDNRTATPG